MGWGSPHTRLRGIPRSPWHARPWLCAVCIGAAGASAKGPLLRDLAGGRRVGVGQGVAPPLLRRGLSHSEERAGPREAGLDTASAHSTRFLRGTRPARFPGWVPQMEMKNRPSRHLIALAGQGAAIPSSGECPQPFSHTAVTGAGKCRGHGTEAQLISQRAAGYSHKTLTLLQKQWEKPRIFSGWGLGGRRPRRL